MRFGFRKSFKIAPGLRVNLGKSGVTSVRVGPRGAGVTVGKKGARATTSLPGTGLSFSAPLSGERSPGREADNRLDQDQRAGAGTALGWVAGFFAVVAIVVVAISALAG